MSDQGAREMTLAEWVGRLHEGHKARKEYEALVSSPASPAVRGEEEAEAFASRSYGRSEVGWSYVRAAFLAGFSRGGEVEREKFPAEFAGHLKDWTEEWKKGEAERSAEKDARIAELEKEVNGRRELADGWGRDIASLLTTLEAVQKERDELRKYANALEVRIEYLLDDPECHLYQKRARALLASREEKK